MPDLHLTSDDQQWLTQALEALLTPLDYPDADAWRRAVNRALRPLFRADKMFFALPVEGKSDLFTEEYDRGVGEAYEAFVAPLAEEVHLWARVRALGVADRTMVYEGHLDEFHRSAYWNEYLRPARAYDSLTVSVQVGPRTHLDDQAQLLLHHDTPTAPPFGERGIALGHLLLPALQSGALAWLRFQEARRTFARVLDALAAPVLLYDLDGRLVHRNRAFARAVEGCVVAEALVEAADDLARRAGRLVRQPAALSSEWEAVSEGCEMPVGTYRLRAVRVGPGVTGYREAVLVTMEPYEAAPLSAEALRARFGLTRQQARVALLLAERKTTAEIAEALAISPHTARRHTEAVMEKLGVHRKTEVAPRLREGASRTSAT